MAHTNEQQIEQRVNFPGFTTTAHLDGEKVQVERGVLAYAGKHLVIDLVRSIKVVKFGGAFLPASIWCGKKELWNFKVMENFPGQAHLVEIGGEPVIAFVEHKQVKRVRSFAEIVLGKQDNLRTQIRLKRAVAKKLGMQFVLIGAEITLQEKEVRKIARQQDEKRSERQKRKEERRDAILRRPHIHVWTEDGKPRHGHPCIGAEWHALPKFSYVVLVEHYNEETGEHRGVVEAFRVGKTGGGKPYRMYPVLVTEQRPDARRCTRELEVPQPLKTVVVDLSEDQDGSDPYPVYVYPDMDTIQRARRAGLNGGSLVSFSVSDGEKFQVMRVHEDRIDTVGERPEYA